MNHKLYENYGMNFLDDFENYAGTEVKLFNVFEGKIPNNLNQNYKKIQTIPFQCPDHQRFLNFFSNLYEARGLRIEQELNKTNNKINLNFKMDFRYDAIRFSFKVFAINLIKKMELDTDYLIWTDADLRCKKKFDKNDLSFVFPEDNELVSYLGRTHFPQNNPFSECGFLIFNCKNKNFHNFINRMIQIYGTGEIFSLKEWHDCWVFDETRREYEKKGEKFKNISRDYSHTEHPFMKSGLEEYFDHLKGPDRKKAGRSFKEDFIK